jgi:hypothetical protein
MNEKDEYRRARKRAEDKVGFYIHFLVYLIVNGVLITINLRTNPEYYWFVWPLFGWGIGVLFHGLSVFFFSEGTAFREHMIEREMERERRKRGGPRDFTPVDRNKTPV